MDFSLEDLPRLPFSERGKLPDCPAVYFVTSGDELLYIGCSGSLRHRWATHHRLKQFSLIPNVVIAWLETPIENIYRVEDASIVRFQPRYNKHVGVPNRGQGDHPVDYQTIRIWETTYRRMRYLAALTDESIMDLFDRLTIEEQERFTPPPA
jgi:hypothetical protein